MRFSFTYEKEWNTKKKIDCFWFVSVFCLWLCVFSSLHLDVMWTFSYMRIHISLPARADTLFGTISTWTLCGRSSHVYLYLTKKYYEWKKIKSGKMVYIFVYISRQNGNKAISRCTCDAVYISLCWLAGWLTGRLWNSYEAVELGLFSLPNEQCGNVINNVGVCCALRA